MTKKQHVVILFLFLVVFLLVFMVSSRINFRADLTAGRIYTLSPTSRNLYTELNDIVRITYFVSDRLVSSHPLPQEIMGLLNEYTVYSKNRIQLIVKDPVKSNLTQEMDYLGIYPQTIRVIENNEIITAEVYTGITIEYKDKTEVLPLVFSTETLEYDITTRILSLAQGRDKEIGVIIGDNSKQWDSDYVLLDTELRRSGYTIDILNPGDEIPQRLSALFVFGGAEELDEWALYRIDFFLQNGGNVLFAQDGLYMDLANGMNLRPVRDMGLLAMIASYGAAILSEMVMDRSSLQISLQESGTGNVRTIPYPPWISVQPENMSGQYPVTGGLPGLSLYWASPIELAPPRGTTAAALFASSPESWLQTDNFTADPMQMLNLDSFVSGNNTEQTKGSRILGAVLSGTFPDFFSGVPKPQRDDLLTELPDMPAVPQPSRIIVIGDSDFASSMMEAGGGEAANLSFLLKAADWLGNDEAAIGLRRTQSGRLDRITDTDQKNFVQNFSLVLNVFIIPAAVLIAGLIITIRRKKITGAPSVIDTGRDGKKV